MAVWTAVVKFVRPSPWTWDASATTKTPTRAVYFMSYTAVMDAVMEMLSRRAVVEKCTEQDVEQAMWPRQSDRTAAVFVAPKGVPADIAGCNVMKGARFEGVL